MLWQSKTSNILKKDYPLEKLQNLNKFGTYFIIISTNTIDDEVLISNKEYKTLTTQIEYNGNKTDH